MRSGALRRANSSKLSPFSTIIIGGSGRSDSGGGSAAMLRRLSLYMMAVAGGMTSLMTCTIAMMGITN
jgi:hypothetical protein